MFILPSYKISKCKVSIKTTAKISDIYILILKNDFYYDSFYGKVKNNKMNKLQVKILIDL